MHSIKRAVTVVGGLVGVNEVDDTVKRTRPNLGSITKKMWDAGHKLACDPTVQQLAFALPEFRDMMDCVSQSGKGTVVIEVQTDDDEYSSGSDDQEEEEEGLDKSIGAEGKESVTAAEQSKEQEQRSQSRRGSKSLVISPVSEVDAAPPVPQSQSRSAVLEEHARSTSPLPLRSATPPPSLTELSTPAVFTENPSSSSAIDAAVQSESPLLSPQCQAGAEEFVQSSLRGLELSLEDSFAHVHGVSEGEEASLQGFPPGSSYISVEESLMLGQAEGEIEVAPLTATQLGLAVPEPQVESKAEDSAAKAQHQRVKHKKRRVKKPAHSRLVTRILAWVRTALSACSMVPSDDLMAEPKHKSKSKKSKPSSQQKQHGNQTAMAEDKREAAMQAQAEALAGYATGSQPVETSDSVAAQAQTEDVCAQAQAHESEGERTPIFGWEMNEEGAAQARETVRQRERQAMHETLMEATIGLAALLLMLTVIRKIRPGVFTEVLRHLHDYNSGAARRMHPVKAGRVNV